MISWDLAMGSLYALLRPVWVLSEHFDFFPTSREHMVIYLFWMSPVLGFPLVQDVLHHAQSVVLDKLKPL